MSILFSASLSLADIPLDPAEGKAELARGEADGEGQLIGPAVEPVPRDAQFLRGLLNSEETISFFYHPIVILNSRSHKETRCQGALECYTLHHQNRDDLCWDILYSRRIGQER